MLSRLVTAAVAAYAAYGLFKFLAGQDKEDDIDDSPPQILSHSRSCRSFSPPVDQQRFNHSRTDEVQASAQTYPRVIPERTPQSKKPPRTPVSPRDKQEERQSQGLDPFKEFDALPGNGVCGVCARASANKENKSIKKRRRNSRRAHRAGEHPRVKQPSRQGIQRKRKRERRRAEASAAIFKENNRDRAPWDVDLHGLRVEEAIARARITITDAVGRADPQVRLVVGQGKHSKGGIPRLKPEVQEVVQSLGYRVCVDPRNAGVLIVELD